MCQGPASGGLGPERFGDLGVGCAQGSGLRDVCRSGTGQPRPPFPRGRLARSDRDPGPPTTSGPDESGGLQLAVCPCDCADCQAQVAGELT